MDRNRIHAATSVRRLWGAFAAVGVLAVVAGCGAPLATKAWLKGSWTCTSSSATLGNQPVTTNVVVGDGTWTMTTPASNPAESQLPKPWTGTWGITAGQLAVTMPDFGDFKTAGIGGVPDTTKGFPLALSARKWGSTALLDINATMKSIHLVETDSTDAQARTTTDCQKK